MYLTTSKKIPATQAKKEKTTAPAIPITPTQVKRKTPIIYAGIQSHFICLYTFSANTQDIPITNIKIPKTSIKGEKTIKIG